jgi:hypothetical protein
VGTYANDTGTVTCKKCPRGQYGDETRLTSCTTCSPGKAANETGSTYCFECGPGKRPEAQAQDCEFCPAGKEGGGAASERYIILNSKYIYCDDCDKGESTNRIAHSLHVIDFLFS